MDNFNQIFINTLIILSAISTILLVLEALGFLPYSISKHFIKNKLGLTREVLKEIGVPIKETKEKISSCLSIENKKHLNEKLKLITYDIESEIGETSRGYFFKNYIDLMGATTNSKNAKDFAGILKSYIYESSCIDLSKIDLIVTSKLGSPILGYEFSSNINKPFLLHSSEIKFRPTNSKKYKLQQKFDTGGCKSFKNKTALIVEDSTTGGRKIIQIIKDLRENDINISECLVIFAPQGKKANAKLLAENVTLHAMMDTH